MLQKLLEPDCHPLYMAVWLDTKFKLHVFDTPAPLWPRHTKMRRDRYYNKYFDSFKAAMKVYRRDQHRQVYYLKAGD